MLKIISIYKTGIIFPSFRRIIIIHQKIFSMKTYSIFVRSFLSAVIISSLLFISCNKNNDDMNIDSAGLMAVNLAPGTTVSFASSGNSISPGLPFNSYTGGYVPLFPGPKSIEAYSSNGLVANNSLNFESGKYYSLFLVDTGSALQQVIVEDNFDSLSTTSQSFVRYINAIPGTTTPPSITIAVNGTNVVNESAMFATVSDFTAVDAGSVTITVSNGADINLSRTITLESLKVYTLLISGVVGGTGNDALQIKYIVNGTVDATAGRVPESAVTTTK